MLNGLRTVGWPPHPRCSYEGHVLRSGRGIAVAPAACLLQTSATQRATRLTRRLFRQGVARL